MFFSVQSGHRNVVGVATDTASMDYGQSSDFEVHQILGKANIWAVENLANAEALPETGTKELFSLGYTASNLSID